MLKLVVSLLAALMLCSCSTGVMQDAAASREVSKSYFRFTVAGEEATSTNIYYVFPQNQTWGNYSVFRVIEPIVDIDSYSEYTIEGTGPDGNGRFRMRVVIDQEQIKSYSSTYFLVSGI